MFDMPKFYKIADQKFGILRNPLAAQKHQNFGTSSDSVACNIDVSGIPQNNKRQAYRQSDNCMGSGVPQLHILH